FLLFDVAAKCVSAGAVHGAAALRIPPIRGDDVEPEENLLHGCAGSHRPPAQPLAGGGAGCQQGVEEEG
ncbi:hypothetical protein ABTD77_20180, partial [Acinetobacter baumannii]